jgi:hypothetical protein
MGPKAESKSLFSYISFLFACFSMYICVKGRGVGVKESSSAEKEKDKHTPFTILVPTLVICPLILSLLGLEITNVLPGSIGASSA